MDSAAPQRCDVAAQVVNSRPQQTAWYNSSLAKKYNCYNFQNSVGKQLSFTLICVGPYADQVYGGQEVARELAKIGIKLSQENRSSATHDADLANGKFDLAFGGPPQLSTDGPHGILRGLLYSLISAPIGKPAASDYQRFSSPAENALFNKLSTVTSVAQQEQIVKQARLAYGLAAAARVSARRTPCG